jgi:hypothetical protein
MMDSSTSVSILDHLLDQYGSIDSLVAIQHAADEDEDLFVVRIGVFGGRKQEAVFSQRVPGINHLIRVRIEYGPRIQFAAYPIVGDPNDPLGGELPPSKPVGQNYIGGDRIMNIRSDSWGTLGFPAKFGLDISNGPSTCSTGRSPCLISNNHVIAMNDAGRVGDSINWLNGFILNEQIGQLSCFIPINSVPRIDVALAPLTITNVAWFELAGIGKITGAVGSPKYNVQYKKSGARTGVKAGVFAGYAHIYVDGRLYKSVGCMSRGFSCKGDSGSVIVDGSMNLIGIVFAGEQLPCGDEPYTYFLPFQQMSGASILAVETE